MFRPLLRALRPAAAAVVAPTRSALLLQQPVARLPLLEQIRNASHAASGRANKAKDGPGKRLGAKKTQGEQVKTGMIIYRQRGTLWFPGENAGMGRDHTIFALHPGYVRYYRDPSLHPDRKYIGIALTPDQKMPRPQNAARTRKFMRDAVPLVEPEPARPMGTPLSPKDLNLTEQYAIRPANWKIGRTMPKVEIKRNNPFKRWQRKAKRNLEWKKRKGMI